MFRRIIEINFVIIQKNFKNHKILFKFQTSLIKSLATRERINRFDPNIIKPLIDTNPKTWKIQKLNSTNLYYTSNWHELTKNLIWTYPHASINTKKKKKSTSPNFVKRWRINKSIFASIAKRSKLISKIFSILLLIKFQNERPTYRVIQKKNTPMSQTPTSQPPT